MGMPFLHRAPSHCVFGQWPGLSWAVSATPLVKNVLEHPSENCIPHLNRSFFFARVFLYNLDEQPLQLSRLYWGMEKSPAFMVAAQLFLKNISQGSPVRLAWYLSNQILGTWPSLNIHRASSTDGTCGSWEAVQIDFWGICLWKTAFPIGSFSCPHKNRKS